MKTLLCYGDSNTYGYDPQTGGRFINCSGKVEVSTIDSEHLTEKGHQQIADLIYNEIAGL